jgi:hypothetical protein
MEVSGRCRQAAVPQQALEGQRVDPGFEQVRGEGMTLMPSSA